WPTDACTTKSGPRYLLIVFAFAGLSTSTSCRPVPERAFVAFLPPLRPVGSAGSGASSRPFAADARRRATFFLGALDVFLPALVEAVLRAPSVFGADFDDARLDAAFFDPVEVDCLRDDVAMDLVQGCAEGAAFALGRSNVIESCAQANAPSSGPPS